MHGFLPSISINSTQADPFIGFVCFLHVCVYSALHHAARHENYRKQRVVGIHPVAIKPILLYNCHGFFFFLQYAQCTSPGGQTVKMQMNLDFISLQ